MHSSPLRQGTNNVKASSPEKVRPAAAYMLSIDDVKEFPKYEKLWKEIFQIR